MVLHRAYNSFFYVCSNVKLRIRKAVLGRLELLISHRDLTTLMHWLGGLMTCIVATYFCSLSSLAPNNYRFHPRSCVKFMPKSEVKASNPGLSDSLPRLPGF